MDKMLPEQLALFYSLSLDLFCVAGADGYFKAINPAWEKTLGYSTQVLLSKPYIEFVHPEDHSATVVEQARLGVGSSVLNFENRYKASDGSWKWLSWVASPQENGEIYAVARDITAHKEEEHETEILLRKLELSNQELDQFAYIVSHDLKTPLRGIVNLSEWIEEDLGSEIPQNVVEHLKLLKDRVSWIQKLIDDLLKYARLGRSAAILEMVNIQDLIGEIKNSLPEYPKNFEIKILSKMPTVLSAKSQLFQIFQNLLVNSIKYRASDHGMVSITCESAGNMWRFKVKDDGIGIKAIYHQKIFEVFHRLQENTEIEGTGIGLAIVKKIVEGSGGQIKVESDGKIGSTFIFSWPKAPR